jgi:uncharacterized membrane protein YwaF|tara:strand:- start:4011 stop:4655 length:645 start_codon:yes stop_codon:yes gene_type:complete
MITNFIPLIVAILISLVAMGMVFFSGFQTKYWLLILSIFALAFSSNYNLTHNPHLIIWLCNFTILFGIGLCFRFHQILFDVFFYFSWTGSLFTLLIFDNPVAPKMGTYPVAFIGFVLKHSIPLLLTVYFIKTERKRLSVNAMRTSLSVMAGYTFFIAIYNIFFNQNILDLRYPTLGIEQLFGPWPVYVLINIMLTILWYKTIDIITNKLGLIHT